VIVGAAEGLLAEFTFAMMGTADRAVARLDPLDVVVEQGHQRFDVARGEGSYPFSMCSTF
jgi:hypothetical protein